MPAFPLSAGPALFEIGPSPCLGHGLHHRTVTGGTAMEEAAPSPVREEQASERAPVMVLPNEAPHVLSFLPSILGGNGSSKAFRETAHMRPASAQFL